MFTVLCLRHFVYWLLVIGMSYFTVTLPPQQAKIKGDLKEEVMPRRNETVGTREAARLLGVTIKYVYDLLWAGRLPAWKTGKTWQISAKAVLRRKKGGATDADSNT
jgi:excisionase family DNA binding protein